MISQMKLQTFERHHENACLLGTSVLGHPKVKCENLTEVKPKHREISFWFLFGY